MFRTALNRLATLTSRSKEGRRDEGQKEVEWGAKEGKEKGKDIAVSIFYFRILLVQSTK
jgi:hypothetical protein